MKKLIFLALWVSAGNTFAQQTCPTDIPYSETAFQLLKNLDKSQIPTGILYESVLPLANIYEYTGNSTTDTTNTAHFLQAYAEIYLSTFNNSGMKHYQTLYDDIDNFNSNPKYYHPIGIIDYNFNTIHPDAINNNLLSLSNQQLYDVPNRSSSPYISEKAIIASILLTEDYPCLYPGQHFFTFTNNFVLSNSGFTLSQVSHLQAIYNGTTIYNSSVAGLDNFNLPLTVSNNDQNSILVLILTVNGQQKYSIISTCQIGIDPLTSCRGQDEIEITGYSFDGGYGEGNYAEKGKANIYYSNASCSDKKLRKPIIFVDGFDPSNSQHHEGIWKEYLNIEFIENGQQSKLGDTLLARGYDVIILDQVKGADKKYNRGGAGIIENNGLVLAKLLETLYAQHGSTMTEDFVVVGASMGGLVSRFGLAWMEANNKPHHTRLFISFDSPQNGAQIPIGLQQMVDKFTQFGGLAAFPSVRNAIHQSNAAKQLLVHHSSTGSESIQGHPFRGILQNNLAAVGNYPSQCRIVSISNGNRIGTKKNIPITPPNGDVPAAINEKLLEADLGIKRRRLAFCNANLCYKLHTQVYAQTASNRFKTNDFTVNTTNLLTLAAAGFPFPFFTKTQYSVAENGTSFDMAPGSRLRQNPLDLAEGNVVQALSAIFIGPLKISTNILKHTNFIPTTSSVAYTFPNGESFNIYKNFTGVNLSKCAGTTPFDTVYAPSYDMPHVAIDQFIANSFREEVYNLKNKSYCSGDCPDYINLTSSPQNTNYQAAKAICLLPNFKAEAGTVFKAQIGCQNAMSSYKPNPNAIASTLTICPFDWDQPKNQVICFQFYTTFKAFVKYLPIGNYAEFSTNGSSWTRANVGDNGYTINLNANPGQSQMFYARPNSNPANVIQGWLQHCP
ncbi:MAG: hypothetical protein U0V04_18060 [Spirosomataceae bacterium]|jgi:pimeloyl-ACP methyl ester carboxylesterase